MADVSYDLKAAKKGESYTTLLNSADPLDNLITIDGVDYYMGYLDENIEGNKGGNSYIYKLYPVTEYDNGNETPASIIKISRIRESYNRKGNKPRTEKSGNQRFRREISALKDCKSKHVLDVIEIYNSGNIFFEKANTNGFKSFQSYPYYTMEVAQGDLKSYMESHFSELGLEGRISICLDIAKAISGLLSLDYYHRDLKPDNIFVVNGHFKVGDLGLISKRNEDYDKKGDYIGPRGWTTPETMNKYLTEGKNFGGFDVTIDHQSDIFQLGMIFWYIMQGNAPIGELRQDDFKIKRDDIYGLIHHMLNHSKIRRVKNVQSVIAELERIQQKLVLEKLHGTDV